MDRETLEKQVAAVADSEQALRTWGISSSRRYARIALVALIVVSIATIAGAGAYIVGADPQLVSANTSGFVLVITLATVILVLRVFQLRAQRADIARFIPYLERKLTGDAEHDTDAQARAENEFEWKSRHYTLVIRMIALAMVVLVTINTYQGGGVDLGRQLVFDGCIAVVVASFAWDQFVFRSELLYEQLKARARASIRYRNSPEYLETMAEQEAKQDEGSADAISAEPEESDEPA